MDWILLKGLKSRLRHKAHVKLGVFGSFSSSTGQIQIELKALKRNIPEKESFRNIESSFCDAVRR